MGPLVDVTQSSVAVKSLFSCCCFVFVRISKGVVSVSVEAPSLCFSLFVAVVSCCLRGDL